jgi:hypothetical protein
MNYIKERQGVIEPEDFGQHGLSHGHRLPDDFMKNFNPVHKLISH